ncbi:IS30 family transposase [Rhizobium beringeri]
MIERIMHGWSPQQIAGRLQLERHPISVSHETIYKFAYSSDGHAIKLWRHLPEHRARRRPRHAEAPPWQAFHPGCQHSLPARRRRRAQTVRALGMRSHPVSQEVRKANVTSLVERVSRFAVLLRNNDRQSRAGDGRPDQVLQSLPHLARRSITFDRGTEFTDWPYLQASIGAQTWFCDPQSPWQKGTVENTNRRARKWLSREVDPLSLSDRDLTEICNHLNATPRKCLGYKTPAEVFRQKLLAQIRRTR